MPLFNSYTDLDLSLARSLADFIPARVYDFHTHLYDASHYTGAGWRGAIPMEQLTWRDWRETMDYNPAFTGKRLSGLFFGMVRRDSIQPAMNAFMREQVDALEDPFSQCLLVATPKCDPATVAEALRSGRFKGIKVYHCYADRPASDTQNAEILEYAPEWMWEIAHEVGGIVLLHMVLPRAVADPRNQRDIRALCTRYPNLKLVLAHTARCFSHRHAEGMAKVADLANVYVDTSAVCEAASMLEALRQFGPRRVMYGSDYFVSELRGRCVTVGDSFYWHHPGDSDPAAKAKATLVGIESLLALREALESFGATRRDVEDLFWNNALRCLDIRDPAKSD